MICILSQNKQNTLRTCKELLLEYETKNYPVNSSKIKFKPRDNTKDIYNITAPFFCNGAEWIAGRQEARDSEYAKIAFFKKSEDGWEEVETKPISLQDPFVAKLKDELVLGGVEVFEEEEGGCLNYRTVFYRGTSVENLERFAKGPDKMKDIRLCELEDGRILVFTRPQGEQGGRGKIGYMIIDKLEDLKEESILKAQIMENQFVSEEWGGANELHRLAGGKIGVLSHIASYDEEGNRHYYSTAFSFHPADGAYTPMKIIAVRSDFKPGPSKRQDLVDVIFSGGLIRLKDNKAELYCGVSDAEGQMAVIEDPFTEYED